MEGTLYHRAVGYSYDSEKIFSNGERIQYREHVPPDVTAQMFWLKNRRPDEWRDRQDHAIVREPDKTPRSGWPSCVSSSRTTICRMCWSTSCR